MAKDWHREDIKAAIRKTGMTLGALSLTHKLSRRAVSVTLQKPWPRVQAIVAKHIGVAPQVIWPSRYDASGAPLRKPHWKQRHPSRAPFPRKRQNGAAP